MTRTHRHPPGTPRRAAGFDSLYDPEPLAPYTLRPRTVQRVESLDEYRRIAGALLGTTATIRVPSGEGDAEDQ